MLVNVGQPLSAPKHIAASRVHLRTLIFALLTLLLIKNRPQNSQ
jgi:hypothetical protein